MNGLFLTAITASILWALTRGNAENLGAELLRAGENAVTLALTLAGAYMIWCGLLKILENSGLMHKMARLLERPVHFLMGEDARDEGVRKAVCINLTANLLGLGNAATPAGLEAMQRMAKRAKGGRPTHGMCMFLLLNASSLQLVPTTVISMRATYGATQPGDVFLPTLICSVVSTVVTVLLGLLCRRRCRE